MEKNTGKKVITQGKLRENTGNFISAGMWPPCGLFKNLVPKFTVIFDTLLNLQHLVNCPELLMRSVLAQIHYMPDTWKGNAHTYRVRDEFSMLFQYKAVSCVLFLNLI